MEIRRAEKTDVEQLIEIRLAFLREDFGEVSGDQEKALTKQLREYYKKHIGDGFHPYVVQDEETIVAAAFLVVQEKPASLYFITGKTGLILNVYTHPEYRHRGIASNMLRQMLKDCEDLELSYLELSATEAGKPLYDKLGFVPKETHYTEMTYHFN